VNSDYTRLEVGEDLLRTCSYCVLLWYSNSKYFMFSFDDIVRRAYLYTSNYRYSPWKGIIIDKVILREY
jgi:hypothetical protein